MRRRILIFTLLLTAAAPVALAQEVTKEEVIDRSDSICRSALAAIAPHLQAMDEAQREGRRRKFVRQGRRMVRKARRYTRDLGDLRAPPEGRRRYRRFVRNTHDALDLLADAFDALAAGRGRLARKRAFAADDQLDIARQAARRYGLRRSCITFVT